jgi:hypothetical protein
MGVEKWITGMAPPSLKNLLPDGARSAGPVEGISPGRDVCCGGP